MRHRYLLYTLIALSLCSCRWGLAANYFELDLRTVESASVDFPTWIAEVTEEGGEFNETDGWAISTNKAFGVGRLYLTLAPQALQNDLALSFASPTASNIAIQLYDDQERILAVDLLGQRQPADADTSITTLLIPLNQYPTAHHVVLRRLEGPISIQYISLFPVEQALSPEEANLTTLAQQFGDPLAPGNPLLATIQKSTANSASNADILETPVSPYRPIHSLGAKTQSDPIDESELLTILQILGLQGYDFNAFDFVKAAGEGRVEVVDLYLRAGMPIDVQGDNKYTAIAEAATSGELRVLELLCEKGANPEIRTAGGNSALWMACSNVKFEAIRLLIEHGADPNAKGTSNIIPANILVQWRELNPTHALMGLELLLENGTDPNIRDILGRSLLHIAVDKAHSAEVATVLRYQPNLELANRYGLTPMMSAKYRNIRSIERALLAAGAKPWEPNFTNIDDELIYAMHRREKSKTIKLVQAGANPNIDDIKGQPLAFRVVRTSDIEYLKQMVELGLDINVRNDWNKSLLTAPNAQYSEKGEAMMTYLLEIGLDPNYATKEDLHKKKPYWTPLMVAANSSNIVRCQILLDAGADPTTKNLPRRTAAMVAERNGDFQLARELRKAEAAWTTAHAESASPAMTQINER